MTGAALRRIRHSRIAVKKKKKKKRTKTRDNVKQHLVGMGALPHSRRARLGSSGSPASIQL